MTIVDYILTNLIAILALIISIVSLIFGVIVQRKQNRLSVRPLGIVEANWDAQKDKIEVCIKNVGFGPMKIKYVKTDHNGIVTDVTTIGLAALDCIPKGLVCKYAYDMENYPIKPGGSHSIFKCDITEQKGTKFYNIHKFLDGMTIRVKYKDILDNEIPEEAVNTIQT